MRVSLIEDHGVVSEAMRISLTGAGFEVTVVPLPPRPPRTEALVGEVMRVPPDIVLLDLDLGSAGDGARLIAPLRDAGCRVLVLTGNRDTARWGECLAKGALAVMSKSDQLSTMVDTMLASVRGVPIHERGERERLIGHWHDRQQEHRHAAELLARLTPREREVLARLVGGHRVAEIAHEGHVSEGTVRTQVKSILAKLQVTSQIAAIALARAAGMDADGPLDGHPREPVRQAR